MNIKTGVWYPWDGTEECPFDRDCADYTVILADGSSPHYWDEKRKKSAIQVLEGEAWEVWNWARSDKDFVHRGWNSVIGFYLQSYQEPKELTVAEIEEKLGYPVKIVKED